MNYTHPGQAHFADPSVNAALRADQTPLLLQGASDGRQVAQADP